MKHLKTVLALAAFSGCVLGSGLPSVQAAYAVIDSQNIAQQLKTYTETARVALSTAQQATLLAKELASLPRETLDYYTAEFAASVNTVDSAMRQFEVFDLEQGGENSVEGYWAQQFPKFSSAGAVISEDIFRQNNTFMEENRSQDNRTTLKAYKQLMGQLQKNQQQLAELLKENIAADGGLKAQQLANQIAGLEANIKHIELNMQALKVKHLVEKDEAELTTRLNREKLEEKNAAEIKNYVGTLDTRGTWKAVRDPWRENGASTIGW